MLHKVRTLQALRVPFVISASASSIHLQTDSINVSNVFHFLLTSSRCLCRELASSMILSTCWSTFHTRLLTSVVRDSGRMFMYASAVWWRSRRCFLHFLRTFLSTKNICRERKGDFFHEKPRNFDKMVVYLIALGSSINSSTLVCDKVWIP